MESPAPTEVGPSGPPRPAVAGVEELYAAAYPRLVGVLTLVAGSRQDAEEVVQEAFLRLLPRWDRVGRYDDPEGWVRAVAFRLTASRWRRARTAAAALVRLRPAAGGTAEPLGEAAAVLTDMLAKLPVAHRQVLVLHHGLGLPVAEIARELDVAVGTVKSRLARARAAARELGGFDDA